jgi:hypothetical protein
MTHHDEEGPWAAFLQTEIARHATPEQLERVRSRAPLEHRPITRSLYVVLAAYHRGSLPLERLEGVVDFNERLEAEVRQHRRQR